MLNEYYENITTFRRARYEKAGKDTVSAEDIASSYENENNVLDVVKQTKSPLEILRCESGELEANKEDLLKEFKYPTKEQFNSINKGLERVDSAIAYLEHSNKEQYMGLIDGTALKHFDSKGLPIDVVREAFSGQKQSITNSLSGMNSEGDCILYELRRKNLSDGEKEYIKTQHELMRDFVKSNPEHTASKTYLAKNKDFQLSIDAVKKEIPPKDLER